MYKYVLFGVVTVLSFLSARSQNIEGEIVDSETGEPLSGAHVRIDKTYRSVVTDANGFFSFSGINPGEYYLIASFIGYRNDSSIVKVQNDESTKVEIALLQGVFLSDDYLITAIRADKENPLASTTLDKVELNNQNLGQDIPFLVNWTPSLVSTSDAGAGIGYTGMRIRGTDQTRINVTVNGIPINDAESQGVFWVNMPDFAASTQTLQIQRGLGSSTNGAAAFGASVNLETDKMNMNEYGEVNVGAGTFNTLRRSISFGSGLINGHWTADGRVSFIDSDGYIDRAESDLQSYYFSLGYYSQKSILRFVSFSGRERTYQSWYGTPESRVNNDRDGMIEHASNNFYSDEQLSNLLNSGRTYNYYLYENQVDDYGQDHYQLHLSQKLNNYFTLNTALHYTKGKGYFEEYRSNDPLSLYGIEPIAIDTGLLLASDIIRRRWLDNDFYGTTFSLIHKARRVRNTLGGGVNNYEGAHYGEVVWARFAGNSDLGDRFYDNNGFKYDGNIYFKSEINLSKRINLFIDLQYRTVGYNAKGQDIDQVLISEDTVFNFFNPKIGSTYLIDDHNQIYGFAGIGNREPVRNDFIDALPGREPQA